MGANVQYTIFFSPLLFFGTKVCRTHVPADSFRTGSPADLLLGKRAAAPFSLIALALCVCSTTVVSSPVQSPHGFDAIVLHYTFTVHCTAFLFLPRTVCSPPC